MPVEFREEGARFAIFDLDGTLLDTERAYTEATDAVLAPFGARLLPELKRKMMGRGSLDAAQILVDELGVPLSAQHYLDLRKPRLLELTKRADPIPGAAEFVRELAARGIPLALATSSPADLARHKMGGRDWFDVFDVKVFGDDPAVRRPKPAPDIFVEAARRLGAVPQMTLAFEDSEIGLRSALAANLAVIVIADRVFGPKSAPGALCMVADYHQLQAEQLFASGGSRC